MMRLNQSMASGSRHGADEGRDPRDPRDGEGAEIIDLASRRALPLVAQRNARSDTLSLIGGALLVAGLGLAAFWGMNSARTAPEPAASPAPPAPTAPTEAAQAARPPMATAPIPEPALRSSGSVRSTGASAYRSASDPASASAINPYASPTLVYDSSALAQPGAETAPGVPGAPGAASASPGPAVGGGNSASDFASRIGGVGGAPASARAMVNPSTTVTQGTLIPAVLETAIDTDVPGYVRAVVSRDVRSFDGTRVLVPRSSRLIGQYQSGVQGGQKRAYVIWTRLIRPDGASVNLASPAVGFDGTTGLEGKVNTHFFRRFGSAMLLSVIGGLSAIGSAGTSVVLGGGQSAAAAAVQQDSQIGPTIRVRQGEPIRVFTARDLDFSQVE